jgi:hypothetical protein
MYERPKCETGSMQIVEENRANIQDIQIGKYFGEDHRSTGNKSKNRQMGLYQTKNLLHRKRNCQWHKEITYRIRENIQTIQQGVNNQNM